MQSPIASHQTICDDSGKPIDYRFIEVNQAFTKLLSMKSEDILGNAIKFSSSTAGRPRIEIGLQVADDKTICFIKDNGVGIEKSYLGKVFDLFDVMIPNREKPVSDWQL